MRRCKQKFIQEKYSGREYFSGNSDVMIDDIMIEFIKLYNNQSHNEEQLNL